LSLHNVPRALGNRDTWGAVKLVADAETGKILGVHAAAEGAGDLLLATTYAIKAGMIVDDIADTWAPYLTMAAAVAPRCRLVEPSGAPNRCYPTTGGRRTHRPIALASPAAAWPSPTGPVCEDTSSVPRPGKAPLDCPRPLEARELDPSACLLPSRSWPTAPRR
jgi:hypothetical protein